MSNPIMQFQITGMNLMSSRQNYQKQMRRSKKTKSPNTHLPVRITVEPVKDRKLGKFFVVSLASRAKQSPTGGILWTQVNIPVNDNINRLPQAVAIAACACAEAQMENIGDIWDMKIIKEAAIDAYHKMLGRWHSLLNT